MNACYLARHSGFILIMYFLTVFVCILDLVQGSFLRLPFRLICLLALYLDPPFLRAVSFSSSEPESLSFIFPLTKREGDHGDRPFRQKEETFPLPAWLFLLTEIFSA